MGLRLLAVVVPAVCLFGLLCWWLGAYSRLRSLRHDAEHAHANWLHAVQQGADAPHAADDARRTLANHYVVQAHAWNVAAHQWPTALVARVMRWPDMEEACRDTGQPKAASQHAGEQAPKPKKEAV